MYYISDLAAIQAAMAEMGWKQDVAGTRRSADMKAGQKTTKPLPQDKACHQRG